MRTINYNTPIEKLYKYRKAEAIRRCRRNKERRQMHMMSDVECRLLNAGTFRMSYMEIAASA